MKGERDAAKWQIIEIVALSRPATTRTMWSSLFTFATDWFLTIWYDSVEKFLFVGFFGGKYYHNPSKMSMIFVGVYT